MNTEESFQETAAGRQNSEFRSQCQLSVTAERHYAETNADPPLADTPTRFPWR